MPFFIVHQGFDEEFETIFVLIGFESVKETNHLRFPSTKRCCKKCKFQLLYLSVLNIPEHNRIIVERSFPPQTQILQQSNDKFFQKTNSRAKKIVQRFPCRSNYGSTLKTYNDFQENRL